MAYFCNMEGDLFPQASDTPFFPLSSFGQQSLPSFTLPRKVVVLNILFDKTPKHCPFIVSTQSNSTRTERLSESMDFTKCPFRYMLDLALSTKHSAI